MDTTGVTSSNVKDRKFANAYRQVLEENDLEVLPLDFTGIDEDASNRWAYTNWLQLNGLIILPSLRGTPRSNERTYEQIEKYTRMSHLSIEMVDATDLIIIGGGAFNCASWTTMKLLSRTKAANHISKVRITHITRLTDIYRPRFRLWDERRIMAADWAMQRRHQCSSSSSLSRPQPVPGELLPPQDWA